MKFDEFKTAVVNEIEKRMTDGCVKIQNIVKNNNVNLTGLLFVNPNTNLSPIIYLEKYYEELCEGEALPEVIDKIWQVYLGNRPAKAADISVFTQWAAAKERVVVKLVHYEGNMEILKTMPHRRFLNLAVVYYYVLDVSDRAAATILINNYHLNMWGIHQPLLDKAAYQNYDRFYVMEQTSLNQLVCDLTGEELPVMEENEDVCQQMYVITNQAKLYGASVMLFPEKFKMLAEKFESDLYILPSSIHEVLVMPKLGQDVEELKQIVLDVNHDAVLAEERLSDSVYYYSREKGEIGIAVE